MSNTAKKIQRWFPDSFPAPMVDHHTLPWWEACNEEKLTAQCCRKCHHTQLPPAPICSECHSNEFELIELNGKGTLYTYTAVHQPLTYEEKLPFFIVVIELDVSGTPCKNSVRLMSNIVDAEENELEIGKQVEVVWERFSEFVCVPRFRLKR
jgi:uncharacterized OB-fold protein